MTRLIRPLAKGSPAARHAGRRAATSSSRSTPARKSIAGPGWTAEAAGRLNEAITHLGLPVSDAARQRIATYAELLLRWNQTFNLLGATTLEDLIDLHLIDCLATLPALDQWLGDNPPDLHDIGSGAGLPGILLAITRPEWSLTLVEPVNKKAAFLRQTIGALQLHNATVIEDRVESLPAPQPGAARTRHFIGRAFTALDRFLSLVRPAASEDSLLFAMKAARAGDEIEQLGATGRPLAVTPLATMRPDLERVLIILSARPTPTP